MMAQQTHTEDATWRDRLLALIKCQDKSKRSVSLAIGASPGYVHSILAEGKDPSIDNLLAISNHLGVSAAYLIYGYDVTPEVEEILHLLQERPESRSAILQLLRDRSGR